MLLTEITDNAKDIVGIPFKKVVANHHYKQKR